MSIEVTSQPKSPLSKEDFDDFLKESFIPHCEQDYQQDIKITALTRAVFGKQDPAIWDGTGLVEYAATFKRLEMYLDAWCKLARITKLIFYTIFTAGIPTLLSVGKHFDWW